jgi:hypothetical protein
LIFFIYYHAFTGVCFLKLAEKFSLVLAAGLAWHPSQRRQVEVTVLNPSDLFGKVKTCFSKKRYGRVID